MDNLITVAFEAHHDDLNRYRCYRITIGRDLRNDWTVTISYGRFGQSGQQKHFGGASTTAMQRIVREA